MAHDAKKYDLEERVTIFSENLVGLCKMVAITEITKPIVNQLLRSGTSIGANYYEANGASSRKDFRNKIFICKKESKETLYWLRLLGISLLEGKTKNMCRTLWKETHEFVLIFSKISISTK